MAIITVLITALFLIVICIDDGYSGMCQYNFDVMACYGPYVNPQNCPRKKLIINSPLSVVNLAKCRSTNVLTILFNKQCPLTIQAARPILTIPPICLDRVSPPEYRSSASISASIVHNRVNTQVKFFPIFIPILYWEYIFITE